NLLACNTYFRYEERNHFMMNKTKVNLCVLAVLAATSLPVLAASIDVKVIGTITPAACTPMVSGGGTIDYGTIKAGSLSLDEFTALDEKQLDLSISCAAPAKVALKATNNRPNTVAGATTDGAGGASLVNIFGKSNVPIVGLGLDGTHRIGGYVIKIEDSSVIADSKNVDSIYKNVGEASWTKGGEGVLYNDTAVRQVSWATSGASEPVAFQKLTGKVTVRAYINKASDLDLTKPVQLNGSSTIELVYL
ncbi:MAG: DUF1120 domain-containing protein, partial [Serratia liquefaciens]|nr:DUF1120 domain-containing protein [Serratia liquefaciens]